MESWLREGRRGSTAGVMRGPYVIWEGKTSAERHNYCSVESLVQTTEAARRGLAMRRVAGRDSETGHRVNVEAASWCGAIAWVD
jgi:hypothetical protein